MRNKKYYRVSDYINHVQSDSLIMHYKRYGAQMYIHNDDVLIATFWFQVDIYG